MSTTTVLTTDDRFFVCPLCGGRCIEMHWHEVCDDTPEPLERRVLAHWHHACVACGGRWMTPPSVWLAAAFGHDREEA